MNNSVVIHTDRNNDILAYAADELAEFLRAATSLTISHDATGDDPAWRFRLEVNAELEPTTFSVLCDAHIFTLTGHDPACVLHAVYEFLEQAGIFFDVTGPILPAALDLSALRDGAITVKPFVRRRGIRQHINFTMDVSSYPLAEAREYVRNLARMRMNHITIHSYKGQWYSYTEGDQTTPSGNFFYGHRYDIPEEEPLIGNIRNRRVFCIPEIEESIDQPQLRSELAVGWLNAVMAQAKVCGMHVQISIEPTGLTLEEGVAVCRDVLTSYPLVDTFELITPETGGETRSMSVDALKAMLQDLFGPDVLNDVRIVEDLSDDLVQLQGTLRDLARNLAIVNRFLAGMDAQSLPEFVIAVYATCPATLRVALRLMERYVPAGVAFAFLPAHGARTAVDNLQTMGFRAETVDRTMLYSWIEFDGNMFLQQNSIVGTRNLLAFAGEVMAGAKVTAGEQVAGVSLNHWRTAENRTCIRYAAEAFLNGPLEPAIFYRRHAARLGISNDETYASVMAELDELDAYSRDNLFNVGFCVTGCWVRPQGLRWTRRWKASDLESTAARFDGALVPLRQCLASASTVEARRHLRLLINRVECTTLHLAAVLCLVELHEICDDERPHGLDEDDRQTVRNQCDKALVFATQYMRKHAEQIVDRGCEGTLINYRATIPVYIDHIRELFANDETECTHLLPRLDEPPPPMVVA